ncbi:hypothetical protein M0R45_015455 [Rubus argutus]|uniref:Viral late gene transcription factor 3 zinc ribbon domain-containing protein n=1 Tax=Rubus argutus TaxID=59490 RepID=A0AAW1XQM0_RUBAR
MEASVCSLTLLPNPTSSKSNSNSNTRTGLFPSINITKAYDHSSFTRTECHNLSFTIKRSPTLRPRKAWKIAAIEDVSSAVADPTPIVVTWQIVVGAIAGFTPFVVAGIEFSKRIIAQKRCEVCGGSGLVLTKENYMKCPGCGGFLPWQSWKRFFTG